MSETVIYSSISMNSSTIGTTFTVVQTTLLFFFFSELVFIKVTLFFILSLSFFFLILIPKNLFVEKCVQIYVQDKQHYFENF